MNTAALNTAPFNEAPLTDTQEGAWFAQHLPLMVPEIYAAAENEDWGAILSLFSLTLDSVKNELDVMPDSWHADTAPRDMVARIGAELGFAIDPTQSIESQRVLIAQAVHAWKRKGTYRDINAALLHMGVTATVRETRLDCLRLNAAGLINQSRIAGRVYNVGVLLFESAAQFPAGFCEAIQEHTPAGVRLFRRITAS